MDNMSGLFGIFAFGCGIYCLYAYYLLKVKKEISASILLPKGTNVHKCKDVKGYCREMSLPLLLLGLVTCVYGAVEVYNAYVGGVDTAFLIVLVLLVVTIVFFVIINRKINKKYFDI